MAKNTMRVSQLVTTFGPGAMVDLPDGAVMISGLDYWNYDARETVPVIHEERLRKSLARQMERPPEHFRFPPVEKDEDRGFRPAIVAWDFPGWFVVQKSEWLPNGGKRRRLVEKSQLEKGKFRDDQGKQHVVPVRFVRACNAGHCDDIDWRAFVHEDGGRECIHPLWIEERGTSGTLADTWIVCGCGANRSMSIAARAELSALGFCSGRRPWLGPASRETCDQRSRLLVRSASNAYFPQLVSAISLPGSDEELVELVARLWEKGLKSVAQKLMTLQVARTIGDIGVSLRPYDDHQIEAAMQKFEAGSSDDEPRVKEVEFEVLASAQDQMGSDVPNGDFFARRLPEAQWKNGNPWMEAFSQIVLVHRLREVVTQIGFTRFEAKTPELNGEYPELDLEVDTAPLAREIEWLPAFENRGEGIFLEFSSKAIKDWVARDAVQKRSQLLSDGFAAKFSTTRSGTRKVFHGAPFYMVHSFSHLLMTQVALECGYPASSIRERIYAEPEKGRYGMLLYTGSSDAEGTLGGLISAVKHFPQIIQRALQAAELCSNDPVCAADLPNSEIQRELLGSACHGCLLVAETSCEHRNTFLDRPLVVRTMNQDGCEFFSSYGI